MVKNKLFSGLFGEGAKRKKLLSKLKKAKKEYDGLDKKLISGKINKKELDRYYFLKEEINKMAKKFTLKDGKFVLKTEVEGKKMDNVNTQQPSAEAQQPQETGQQVQPEENQQVEAMRQAEAQRQAQIRAQQEAQYRAQQQAQAAQMQEAQRQAQIRAQQEEMQQAQIQQAQMQEAQRRAQQQQGAPRPVNTPELRTVFISIPDLPELSLGIKEQDVSQFVHDINEAMVKGVPFEFGPAIVNGSKILMYRFE